MDSGAVVDDLGLGHRLEVGDLGCQQGVPAASAASGGFSGELQFSGSGRLPLQGWLENRFGLWFAIRACSLIGLCLFWIWLLRLWLFRLGFR